MTNATVAEVIRLLATADPAIAQIPQNHYAFVETVFRFGSDEQQQRSSPTSSCAARAWATRCRSAAGGRRATTSRASAQADGGYRVDGRKYYCTGAFTAQWIPVFALGDDEQVIVAFVAHDSPGLTVDQDWTAFGQRGTFSGGAAFDGVEVPRKG